jgi:hypothetical protein
MMIRKRFRRRPEFESLESMLLLGAFAPEHPSAAAVVATVAKVKGPVVLSGSAIGTYHLGKGLGTPITIATVGLIRPLGLLKLKGSILFEIANPTGRLTFNTARGKVFANVNATAPGSLFSYTITGGTGRWANLSGGGEALVSTVPSRGRGSSNGRISITFMNLTVV